MYRGLLSCWRFHSVVGVYYGDILEPNGRRFVWHHFSGA